MTKDSNHINLGFRPKTYFWAQDLKLKLPSDIAGAERRRLYNAAVEAGDPSLFLADEEFSREQLESALRHAWGALHPANMGGEYLPKRRNHEVEIARIVIDSTTRDVTSVYAKRGRGCIRYRVVDEYNGDTLSGPNELTSKEPLTLKELVDFFLGTWDLIGCLDYNFEWEGYDREKVHGFLLSVSSDFYPDFSEEVERRVDEWLETKPAREADEGGEE